jgi:hypothetical protein
MLLTLYGLTSQECRYVTIRTLATRDRGHVLNRLKGTKRQEGLSTLSQRIKTLKRLKGLSTLSALSQPSPIGI